MAKEKIEMIPLSAIVNKFDVRIALDNDRVIQFAGMYESGVELPPVKVVRIDEDTFAYIDGRTRGAARAYLNLPDVPAVICNGSLRDNPLELFAEALEANWGGSKPPSRDDITHTILRMLELGASKKSIKERLAFLPAGSCRAYIDWAGSVLAKRRRTKALSAITDGMNIDEAAQTYRVKLDSLKDAIAGKKGKSWVSREGEVSMEAHRYISRVLASANKGISKKIEGMLKQVEDGEVTPATAAKAIKAWSEHLRKTSLRVDDWQARLEAITRETDKSVAAD